MTFEVEGRVSKILPLETGQSANGTWKKQIFVIKTLENYPKDMAFTTWGDLTDAVKLLKVGQKVKVIFRVESREFNGRWYTDLNARRITKIIEEDISGVNQFTGNQDNSLTNQQPTTEEIVDDLISDTEDSDISDFSVDDTDDNDLPDELLNDNPDNEDDSDDLPF